jgi:pimeloyl-ACP methyl ester carboxylesterase
MKTRFLDIPDGRLAFDDSANAGPLIVAVPGMGDLRSTYRHLTPRLAAAGYRVVTVDLPGHGESSVGGWRDYSSAALGTHLIALVRHVNAGPAVLIGNSFAGGAIVTAAAKAPQEVAALVIEDGFVRDIPGNALMNALFKLALAGPWRLAAWTAYYPSLFKARKPADLAEHLARLRANLREPGRFDSLVAMTRTSQAAAEAALSQVRAPTLVVMGTRDPDFKDPEGEARLVATRLNGQVALIPGAGHYPHAEMPEETASVILDFLKGATARA